jgi:hypothetical protein
MIISDKVRTAQYICRDILDEQAGGGIWTMRGLDVDQWGTYKTQPVGGPPLALKRHSISMNGQAETSTCRKEKKTLRTDLIRPIESRPT